MVRKALSRPPSDLVGPPGRRSPAVRGGFSLIEVLIAALLLLVILLGVVPLFIRSMTYRVEGRESTAVGSFARTRVETLLQLPFDHPDLTVPAGSNELETVEYRTLDGRVWSRDAALADQAIWTRTTRVRQFGAGDLADGDTDGDGDDLDRPLPGGTNPRSVQLKEIEVRIESPREAGPLGPAEELTVRALKAF
ncbi:MAG: hypothetical protein PVG07_12155 [Acidobacteriota bacterium]|jgi:type II secretory pathway pseudopilin PulG